MPVMNPFITRGYVSPHYFCDRENETENLISLLKNGNNVVLMSPRRMGKTGLIRHCFQQLALKEQTNTFLVDIYATKNLHEFVFQLGKAVLGELKPRGRRVWETFVNALSSLRSGITFDINGNPEWSIGLGDIKSPMATLDEIFQYLKGCDKHCIVAIDEFQTIAYYPEKNVEALLRTYIQYCNNATFIFCGSQRHMMSEMFASPARPFYQSSSMMTLAPIVVGRYVDFACRMFAEHQRQILPEVVEEVYQRVEGVTWYVQSILNALFSLTEVNEICRAERIDEAIQQIIDQQSFAYSTLLYQLPSRQKELLMAICREGKASNITSSRFLKKYKFTASSVQSAIKGLLEKDLVANNLGVYTPYDQFFALWILQQS